MIFRLGRVLGRQEASLVAKNRKNYKKTHLFMKKIGKLGRHRSNFGLRSSRPDQKYPQDRRKHFRKIWAWKTLKKQRKINKIFGFFPIFPLDLAQNPLNPRTNGWAPFGTRLRIDGRKVPEPYRTQKNLNCLNQNRCEPSQL